MKIVVACGGTGGHTFPGIAVAEELVRRGHEVVVWNSGRSVESGVLKRWSGWTFSTGAKQLCLRNGFAILRSFVRCRRELKRFRPNALLAMGSYSSLPPVLAAKCCGVPVVLHEANTIPGKAVEFLSRYAQVVATSFEMTAKCLPTVRTVKTGLPIRREIADGHRFSFIPATSFVVFVTGGSQGAHMVNELASKALEMMSTELAKRGNGGRGLYVIHQTGVKDEGRVMAVYAAAQMPARVHAFEQQMADAFASADLVIARAGASTCFELAACGKPAFLIPLPTAMRDHQHFNAEAFVAAGAADEGIQSKLTARHLCDYLIQCYDNPERLAKKHEKMAVLAMPDATARVADLVEASAKK